MANQTENSISVQSQEWDDEELAIIFTDEFPQSQEGPRLRLVGKLFTEREISRWTISGKINGAWSHFCEPTVHEVQRAKNTFIFTFGTAAEMEKARVGRPWNVSGCMLQLKQWDESIIPQDLPFDLADFWIQIHGIPEHRKTVSNIQSAVAMFKQIHNIDMRGLNSERYMEFVRVLVQVDLNRPLPPGSYFNNNGCREWMGFRYEKLYSLCYYCGRYGHNKQECPRRIADVEARVAGPPEGRFTPWMKAGTNARRPPPPPRGRIMPLPTADTGSSSNSPGFEQNQIWVAGGGSPGTGSFNPADSSSPTTDGGWGLAIRGPSGFTPHPFPGGDSSASPRSVSGPHSQRLQSPISAQNMVYYGAQAAAFSPTRENINRLLSPSVVRNLSMDLNEGQWAGMHQAHHTHSVLEGIQAQASLLCTSNQPNQSNLAQVMIDINQKMDLNKKTSRGKPATVCCFFRGGSEGAEEEEAGSGTRL
ncbi:unnamed protein product [Linum trigynum]